ncbi:DHH family phosphoesterase [Kitasatospora sp. NPDC098663]|uniref:DHH family phosphoesterase n=1 Tax=Kitasatospora sp. NPDC098663 TaxID=3364096 RepID=UPI0037F56CE3
MPMLRTVDDHSLTDEDTGLFEVLCRRRGWSDRYLKEIEATEHDELLDLAEMVEALHDARTTDKKITIAPDFDMDGISAGVLGYAGLSELGFDVELHLPDYRRGHELAPEDIAEIQAKWPATRVLLTCDGGVNSHGGIAAARALGWTTLVTDHHEELAPGSTADITVDPCRIDETYTHTGICGAHVLYQVIEAYTRVHRPEKLWEIHLLRLFAGLGTVSDVMPVLYENRSLVRDAISIARLLRVAAPKTIPNPRGGFDADPDAIDVEQSIMMQLLRTEPHHPVFLRAFEGFAIVLKAFAQAGKIRDVDDLDEGFFGFYLAPAMNSPRRTGASLEPCFAVFTAAGADVKFKAARQVIEGNELRKQLVIKHMEELVAGEQPLAPWVYFSDAYPGMYGLLANRMMEFNGHPVVVLNRPTSPDDPVSGSGRAPEWYDIITSLEPHDGLSAIGHQQACGVRVAKAEKLGDLVAVLKEATQVSRLAVSSDGPNGDLVLGPDADCDAGLEDLQPLFELVRRTEGLKPFGRGFTAPVVEIAIEPLGLRVDRIGSESQHLRLVTRSGLSCLWWNAAEEKFDAIQSFVGAPAAPNSAPCASRRRCS